MKSKISANLHQLRKLRGITQEELAAQLTILSGETVTAVTVSRWENSRRDIPAYMLGYAAQILHTSAQAFYDAHTTPDDKRLLLEYAALPEREKAILRHVVSGWEGDTHALVHWLAMYIGVDRAHRADIAGLAIQQYKDIAKAGNAVKGAPAPDMEYLEKACHNLEIKKER